MPHFAQARKNEFACIVLCTLAIGSLVCGFTAATAAAEIDTGLLSSSDGVYKNSAAGLEVTSLSNMIYLHAFIQAFNLIGAA